PDGSQYAVGRYDGTLRLVDPESGKAVTALPVKPKPPAVTAVTPTYLVRGRTTRLTLTGQRLDTATGLVVPAVPRAQAVRVSSTAYDLARPADAPVGPVQFRLTSAAGESASVLLTVLRYPAIEPVGGVVKLPASFRVTLNRPGDVYTVRIDAAAGQAL